MICRPGDARRWPKGYSPPQKHCGSNICVTPGAGRCSLLSPTGATYGTAPLDRSHTAAEYIAATGVECVVVDCETGRFRLGLADTLARHLRAEYVPLGQVNADAITSLTRQRLRPELGPYENDEVA